MPYLCKLTSLFVASYPAYTVLINHLHELSSCLVDEKHVITYDSTRSIKKSFKFSSPNRGVTMCKSRDVKTTYLCGRAETKREVKHCRKANRPGHQVTHQGTISAQSPTKCGKNTCPSCSREKNTCESFNSTKNRLKSECRTRLH